MQKKKKKKKKKEKEIDPDQLAEVYSLIRNFALFYYGLQCSMIL